jgi:hypothetical protein
VDAEENIGQRETNNDAEVNRRVFKIGHVNTPQVANSTNRICKHSITTTTASNAQLSRDGII